MLGMKASRQGEHMRLETFPGCIALCAALALAPGAALAADVAVLPVRGTNLTAGEADAIGVLFAEAYAREARVDVVAPADAARAVTEAGGVPAALARLGAREYLDISAVQLKSRITVNAVLRGGSGAALHTAEMTAASLDDIQPIAERISRALINRTTPEVTRTLTSVTAREGQRVNRTFTEKIMGLKTSVTWPFARGYTFDPSISLQFDGRLELTRGFLEFGAGAVVPTSGEDSGMGGVFAEFGGSYYLAQESVSPYVGAGFVPRIYFTSSAGGFGAAAYGQAGLMFMRESSSRIYAELRVTQAVTPFENDATYDYVTGTYSRGGQYFPTEVGLQIGIGW